ncbi:MAG: nickel pincer cofactor biosynthesis protein LarC [Deltaproteobacteria bacterium]|nr:nickel pincer cofactor biosynthesis protein LarC [Deltaproteobacteria bacterium]
MKILYFDCPTGISGDMCLGALIDLGVDFDMILSELKKLTVDEIDITVRKEVRHSITGTSFRVHLKEAHHHRTFRDIARIIDNSPLSLGVKELSVAIFREIAEAEGKVHGIPAEEVHFHEVGAMDSIIDIVGAAVAVKSLGVDSVVSSAIPLGSGWADTMHGRIPIPAPATVEILKGAPVVSSDIPFELTTPTGAAIIKTLAGGFGPLPDMTIERVGYGAGKKDFKERANLLRVVVGEGLRPGAGRGERLFIIETNIDDMSPQLSGYLMDRLLDAGALDVFFTPAQMKKNRPGLLLTVLAGEKDKERLIGLIFAESTSIGVRSYPVERACLERRTLEADTVYGKIRVKASYRDNRMLNAQPEYEDCRAAAMEHGVPLKQVMDAAKAALKG